MDDGHIRRRQRHAWIQLRDRRVVPFLNLAEEDVSQNRSGEFQFAGHASNVVDRYDSAEHRGEVEDASACCLQLILGHRSICGAKEHRLVDDLLNTAA